MARAIGRVAGNDIEAYARDKLFSPLQISNWEWLKDSDGDSGAHYGLRLTPRDMLKIGQLVLQNGNWNGKQIVSATWIEKTIDHQDVRRYGYHWWLETFSDGENKKVQATVAYGKGGQCVFVLPNRNAVIVLTAGHYDNNQLAVESKNLLELHVLPNLELPRR